MRPFLTLPLALSPLALPAPGSPAFWLAVAIALMSLLGVTARLLNALAPRFARCPHCQEVTRAAQRVCQHCLKPSRPQDVRSRA